MKKTVLAMVLTALVLAALPAAAPAASGEDCTPVKHVLNTPFGPQAQQYFDPILFPGQASPGSPGRASHWHNFFGTEDLDENSFVDPASLLVSASSCDEPLDHSAYWAPSIVTNPGVEGAGRVNPIRMTATLKGRGLLPPLGLAVISHEATWDCGPGTRATLTPHLCPQGTVQARVEFPRFWDGVNLHLAGEAHVSFFKNPITHPVKIAKLVLRFDFGAPGRTHNWTGTEPQLGLSVGGKPMPRFVTASGAVVYTSIDYPILEHDPLSMHADALFAFAGDPR